VYLQFIELSRLYIFRGHVIGPMTVNTEEERISESGDFATKVSQNRPIH
jgi:hypothetical protein